MKRMFLLPVVLLVVSSCTKEVPESEKKSVKASVENEIKNIFSEMTDSYNSGNIDSCFLLYENDFTAFGPQTDSIENLEKYRNQLTAYRSQNPDKKLSITIEDIYASDELVAVQSVDSFNSFDPIENRMSPVYSERSIRLLKKNKSGEWKIFKALSAETFSY